MDAVTATLAAHYARTFERHGAVARGVDWGAAEDVALRYDKMLAVIARDARPPAPSPSLLDVGCGYGGLLAHARSRGISLDYTGLDACGAMVEHARAHAGDGRFEAGDVLEWDERGSFDYVVCNGILTQKLDVPPAAMDDFAARLVRRLFALARRACAFNMMTTHVNYTVGNLYYRDPAEVLAWCAEHLTRRVVIDHSYPLYEFTTYLYREPA